jgi:peptidoglycan-N-acetylglucosamine deacetylase
MSEADLLARSAWARSAEPKSAGARLIGARLVAIAALAVFAGASASLACEPGSGVARVIEIAPGQRIGAATGYPPAALNDREVILTFDDGPNPATTPGILDLLASQCLRATFFPIGAVAKDHPDLVRRELAEGHSLGGHTFSHADLSEMPLDQAEKEIRDGFAPLTAAGAPAAFLRLPELRASKQVLAWLKDQGIAVIGVDIDGSDWKGDPPDEELARIDAELTKRGRGIIIMHDSQPNTALYLPRLLQQLHDQGYRVVQIKPRAEAITAGR